MPIMHGAGRRISAIKRGTSNVKEIRRGSVLVWRNAGLRDDFGEDRGYGLGPDWTDHGPAVSPYLISVNNESYARVYLPDNIATITGKTSQFRYNAGTASSDDGYLEIKVGTQGATDNAYETVVYKSLSDGAFTDGTGISLRANVCRIVTLISGVKADRAVGGSFKVGDVIRLVTSGGGTLHQLFKNGRLVCWWPDPTGIAKRGGGFRSYGMSMFARKDSLFVGRHYSPGIEYIESDGGDPRIRPMASCITGVNSGRTPTVSFKNYVPAANDFILAGMATTDYLTGSHTDPPGWTTIGEVASDANVGRLAWHKVTQAEADARQTSWALSNYLNQTQRCGTIGVVFRGVDPTTPIDALASTFDNTNNATPHIIPALAGSSLSNRSLVVGFVCADANTVYSSPPAGWDQLVQSASNQIGRTFCIRSVLTQAGVNVLAAPIHPSPSGEYVGFSVALTEAPFA